MVSNGPCTITLPIASKFYRRFQTMATASVTPPWHAAYPAPRTTPATICREDVLDMIKQAAQTSSRDYILIDLRRSDLEVCNSGRYFMFLFKELSNVGRYYPRFDQPPRAELVPYYTDLIHALQERRPL
jgi:hypothetical protein